MPLRQEQATARLLTEADSAALTPWEKEQGLWKIWRQFCLQRCLHFRDNGFGEESADPILSMIGGT